MCVQPLKTLFTNWCAEDDHHREELCFLHQLTLKHKENIAFSKCWEDIFDWQLLQRGAGAEQWAFTGIVLEQWTHAASGMNSLLGLCVFQHNVPSSWRNHRVQGGGTMVKYETKHARAETHAGYKDGMDIPNIPSWKSPVQQGRSSRFFIRTKHRRLQETEPRHSSHYQFPVFCK